MNENLRESVRAVQIGKDNTYAQMEAKRNLREQLDAELAEFLAKGGEIKHIPTGQSGEPGALFNNRLTKPKNAQKSMRAVMSAAVASAKARRETPSAIARQKALDSGEKRFNGTPCITCGGTLRYTSTNSCFACNKASAYARAQKRRAERYL
ncbi:hypothetical protein ACEWX4_07635 [Acinetobacter indicus]|uniref:hypothetical protein n=1 Tax=Acinetobacter indicus TaxID=756892 RepID=UPI0012E16A0C|nr:hypothetical protein [Acinetobacter indicus]